MEKNDKGKYGHLTLQETFLDKAPPDMNLQMKQQFNVMFQL